MSCSTYGNIFKITAWGKSHRRCLDNEIKINDKENIFRTNINLIEPGTKKSGIAAFFT